MSQTLPEAIATAADQRNLGAYNATYLPKSTRDPMRLYLFANGLIVQPEEGDLFTSPWLGLIVFEMYYRQGGDVVRNYLLKNQEQRTVALNYWPQATEFGPQIQQAVTRAWLPQVLNVLAQGKPFNLVEDARRPKNNLALSSQGLTMSGRLWPWNKIRSIEIKLDYLYVKVSGKLTPLAYGVSGIPNVYAVLNAAKHLQSQAT